MATNKTTSLLSLLGGAAAGAAAMYLLDPEAGSRRREVLTDVTSDALRSGGTHLGSAWEKLSEHARDIGQHLSATAATAGAGMASHLGDAADGARSAASSGTSYVEDLGKSLLQRAKDLTERLTEGASSAGSSVSDYSHDAADSVRAMFGRERESHATAYVVGALATAALGAGAMYFLDPERGRSRRAWAGQKANRVLNETSRTFHQAGKQCRHLMNRSRGVAHDIGQNPRVQHGMESLEQLTDRVRTAISKVVTRADLVHVMAKAEGAIELTGRVLSNEADALLQAVRRVLGVNQVENRLDVVDRVDSMNAGSTM